MLYDEVYVGKVVCLKCGAKIDVDKLAILDVSDMEDIPKEVKACGAFFQTLACPKCKKSVYLGFVAEVEEKEEQPTQEKKTKKRRKRRLKKAKVEVNDVREEDFEAPSSRIVRSEDGTIDLDAPMIGRKPRQKAECTRCGNMFDVGTEGVGGFGSKCPECMKLLVQQPGAAGAARGIKSPNIGQQKK